MAFITTLAIATGAIDIAYHFAFGLPLTPSGLFFRFLLFFTVAFFMYGLYHIFIYPYHFSPYRNLPAVPNPHWLWGNYVEYGNHHYSQGLDMASKHPGTPFTRFYGVMGMDQIIAVLICQIYQLVMRWLIFYLYRKLLRPTVRFCKIIATNL